MTNVDDDAIRGTLRAKLYKINSKGKTSFVLADKVFDTYEKIKNNGYKKYCSGQYKANFHRHVKLMEECGISKAFLKSLSPEADNSLVVPIVHLIDIDFSNQRPDWYIEPKCGFDDPRRELNIDNIPHLRLVA